MKRIINVAILVVAASSLILGQSAFGGATSAVANFQAPPRDKAAKTAINPPEETSNTVRWEIKPSQDLTGAKGRLVVDFHDEVPMAHMLVKINSKDGGDPVSDRKQKFDLLPGAYDVVVANKRITDVPIQSGQETHLLMGLLRVVYTGADRTDVYDSDKKTLLVKDYGTLRLGLPIGKYWVKMAGRMVQVEIKNGQVAAF
jgi:hypothetical protein